MRGPQHLEDLFEALGTDDFPDADELDVLGWNLDREVTLFDAQHEVFLFDTADGASLYSFNECGPVVGVDNGLADTKTHRIETPFAVSSLTRHRGFPRQWNATNSLVSWYVTDYSTAPWAFGRSADGANEAQVAPVCRAPLPGPPGPDRAPRRGRRGTARHREPPARSGRVALRPNGTGRAVRPRFHRRTVPGER
ncbi:hypothetical protein GCM10009853_066540 [Glycomyces scopariae]